MKNIIGRVSVLGYGIICYLIFFGTFLYLIGFINNLFVSNALDSHRVLSIPHALIVDTLLIVFFSLQHSGMARTGFKEKLTKIMPDTIERSTYVLVSSLCLLTLVRFWEPIGLQIWHTENPIFVYGLYALSGLGWLIVLASTFMINHFDLFGLRQVYLNFKETEYQHLDFQTPWFYRVVRHPLYVGFLFCIWFTPDMTVAHFIFAVLLTLYILIAIQFEEKDLADIHGESYQEYQAEVPMLIPRILKSTKRESPFE